MTMNMHHPRPVVGTSGALLYITNNITVKVAPQKATAAVRARINEQSSFMLERDTDAMPRVYAKWLGGYAMETLEPLERYLDTDNRLHHLEIIRRKLEFDIWRKNMDEQHVLVAGSVLLGHHRDYISNLLTEWSPSIKHKMLGWMLGVSKLSLSQVITHGDPTIDNLMMRRNGSYVITDPIPASPRMPALLAVDLGKMLQSVYGYEDIKKGRVPTCPFRLGMASVLGGHTPQDVEAAKYFCAVHMLRLIPYQKYHRNSFLEILEGLVRNGTA